LLASQRIDRNLIALRTRDPRVELQWLGLRQPFALERYVARGQNLSALTRDQLRLLSRIAEIPYCRLSHHPGIGQGAHPQRHTPHLDTVIQLLLAEAHRVYRNLPLPDL